jgi:hypothetical protein
MKDQTENKETEVLEGEVVEAEIEVEMLATPDDIKEAVEYLKIPHKSLFNISLIDIAIFTALKLKDVEESCQPKKK